LIANAYAEAYFNDQLQARYDITRRASGWLQDRIAELKANSLRSDLVVQKFKSEKGIISTTTTSGGSALLADQQLVEITTQLSIARAETARAQAKVNQVEEIVRTGSMDSAVTESLGNPVINELRSKYLRASKAAEELTGRVGPRHYQVLSLRNEMNQYRRLIFDEFWRIAETFKSELEVTRAKENSLNGSFADLIGRQAASNETMVQLRELEREADTFKNLYEAFLKRYQDAIQRQTFPAYEARIISPAWPPGSPSSPKFSIVMAIALAFGLAAGGAAAAFREYRDRVFRIGYQIRDHLGLELIGMLPLLASKKIEHDPDRPVAGQELSIDNSVLRQVLDSPLSSFAEALRGARAEIDIAVPDQTRAKIIGLVSVLPGEGKTIVAKNLASLLAFSGSRTLLVDGDFRNPGMTRRIAPQATIGLQEVLRGERTLDEVIHTEADSTLAFVPSTSRKHLLQGSDLLSSPAMEKFFEKVSGIYDYIIVDLPPVGPVVDVRAASGFFDGFVFVIEWGKTARGIVRNALIDDPRLYEKCVGVLLNKVDMDKMHFYHDEGAKTYYYGRYGSYYTDDRVKA
jgi:succinoglycan biosynthesis transport protein ExoP